MTAVIARPRVAIDPRLRARRVSVRRDEGRRRLRRLLVAVGVVTVAGLAVAVAYSPLLAVDHVEVRGAGPTRRTVLAATHLAGGAPILFVDAGRTAAAVRRLPAVASADVERSFPHTVTVTVTLRVPVAWAPAGPTGAALVDVHGVVISRTPTAPVGLPELIGLTKIPAPGGRVAPLGPAALAAALVPALPGRVVGVTLGPTGLTVGVIAGPQLRFGDTTALAAKARAAAALLGALLRPASYIDVSVPDAPVTG
jgi:cell division protein FtsQ